MIFDDLYIALRDRLTDPARPSLNIRTIDWFNDQPERMESGETIDGLVLPAVLVRFEQPNWKHNGKRMYHAEGTIYLDVLRDLADDPLTSDRDPAKVTSTRATYTQVNDIAKRVIGLTGDHFSSLGLIGMEVDHAYSRMRVETIALRSFLRSDMDPASYVTRDVPALVINTNPAMPVDPYGIIVRNSDSTYQEHVTAPGTHNLPDVFHTDSNGEQVLLPGMTPMVCTPGGGSSPVIVRQTNGAPGIIVDTIPADTAEWPLPQTVLRYDDGVTGTITTQGYDTLGSSPGITPDVVIPARDLVNSVGTSYGKASLDKLLTNTLPAAPSVPVSRDGVPFAITPAGVPVNVPSLCPTLTSLIQAVPTVDAVAQVFDPQTLAQRLVIKEHVMSLALQGTLPVIVEPTPTYNDEGTDTSGWTLTNGTLSQPSGSVVRLTQTSVGACTADRSITMPKSSADWCLFVRARSRRSAGDAQAFQINGSGNGRAIVYFNFNSTLSGGVGAQQTGTVSIRHVSDGVSPQTHNAVFSTGVVMDTNWQDMLLVYNASRSNLSLHIRQADGSFRFGCQCTGSFFGATLRVTANNSTTPGSWTEWDFITLALPMGQSVGDSLTQGAPFFSPTIASNLNNGDSTWQRWLTIYPGLRNNFVMNKGVGSNTSAMVAARIAADVLYNEPKLVFLSACNNDFGAGISQAQRRTNIQTSINLCNAANAPVVLFNATEGAAGFASQPAARDYTRESWEVHLPALTGVQARVDIMQALRGINGYANSLFTDADQIHNNIIGCQLMAQAISSLPYAS